MTSPVPPGNGRAKVLAGSGSPAWSSTVPISKLVTKRSFRSPSDDSRESRPFSAG
jgi:hypothetical protein